MRPVLDPLILAVDLLDGRRVRRFVLFIQQCLPVAVFLAPIEGQLPPSQNAVETRTEVVLSREVIA